MNISNNAKPQITSRGLVPKNEYKGIILKLTKDDKRRIQELMQAKCAAELEMEKVKSVYASYKLHNADGTWYEDALLQISLRITELKQSIQKIKEERLNKQKILAAKKNRKLDKLI